MQYDFQNGKNNYEKLDDKIFYKLLFARIIGIVGITAIVFAGMKCGEGLTKKYEKNTKKNSPVGYDYKIDSLEKYL